MNCNWTGKLTLLFALSPERNSAPSHIFQSLFGRSNCAVFWKNQGKKHQRGCVN